MKIKCRHCDHEEKPTVQLIVKIIGGVLPIGGFLVWIRYLLAGTGLAFPVVVALITGGTAVLVFKDEIVEWISNKGYECPNCGKVDWEV